MKLEQYRDVVGVRGRNFLSYQPSTFYKTVVLYLIMVIMIVSLNGFVLSEQVDRFTIYSIVGDGNQGNSGDNGKATNAEIGYVDAIEVASNGDVYFADKTYNRIRKVSNGIITTIAGSGSSAGFIGDGGLPTSAKFNTPTALAIYNTDGTIFIGDQLNYRIRKISNQVISTIIGTGTKGAPTEGTASSSSIGQILGVAVSLSKDLYFADYSYHCIGKISGTSVSIVAGICSLVGYSGDNAAATSAKINGPNDVAISPITGELFIADTGNNVIRRVGTDNKIYPFAGTGVNGYSGDGGQAVLARLGSPTSITFSSTGELFIADKSNYVIRKVSTDGIIRTVAGTYTNGFSGGYAGDNGDSLGAQYEKIYSIAYSTHTSELTIADSANFKIRKLSPTVCNGISWSNSSVCLSRGSCSYMDHCSCFSGYSGNNCQNFYCYSIEKDTTGVCSSHGRCIGPNNCTCYDNTVWTGTQCNTPVCFGKINGELGVCNNRGNCSAPNTCACNENWTGTNCEMPRCYNVDGNSSSVCSGRGSCTSANNCTCIGNFYGANCDSFDCYGIKHDNQSVCSGFGTCANPNNCSCFDSYSGYSCSSYFCFGKEKSDLKVCSGQGWCILSNNCSCNEGYYGDECDKFTCGMVEQNSTSVCSSRGFCSSPNNCTCLDGYYGSTCQFFDCFGINRNYSNVCSGHGECIGLDSCTCSFGYLGSNCSIPMCFDIRGDNSSVCSKKGVCSSVDNCVCSNGWFGPDCSIPSCYGMLANDTNICSGHGLCTDLNVCSCFELWGGNECSVASCFGILASNSSVCSGNGLCLIPNSCECSTGFFGLDCENYQCFGVDHNQSDVCSAHGQCISFDQCNCTTKGYFGDDCSIYSCFGTLMNDSLACSSNGTCVEPDKCNCIDGFYGHACELFDCFGSLFFNQSVCNGNGKCDYPNSCNCGIGFYGHDCQHFSCFNINSTSDLACASHGRCINPDTCSCDKGYYGSECDLFDCFGIPSKSLNVCTSEQGLCTSPNECKCHEGYFGSKCEHYLCYGIHFTNSSVCNSRGVCQHANSCKCYNDDINGYWGGDDCGQCLSNNYGDDCKYTKCSSEASCSYHGQCQAEGSCKCYSDSVNGFWRGPICDSCIENYFGIKCQMFVNSTIHFSEYGDQLILETKGIKSSFNSIDCLSVLLNTANLGVGVTCEWNGTFFVIQLGHGFTIRPKDKIYMNLMALGGSNNGSFIEMEVPPPSSPRPPIPIINQHSVCDDFVLDGSQSTSQDAGPIIFEWELLSSSSYTKLSPIIRQVNNQSLKTVSIKHSEYLRGIHVFKLTLKSTLFHTESSTTFTVQTNYDPLPPVMVDSKTVTSVVNLPLIIKGTLNPRCISSDYAYSTSFSKIDGPSLSYTVTNNLFLVVSNYSTLEESKYIFEICFVSIDGQFPLTFASLFSIQTQLSPLDLQIIALDVSTIKYTLGYRLTDPDYLIDIYEQPTWTCTVNGESCDNVLELSTDNTAIINKPTNLNLVNVPLEISLLISKGSRNASSSMIISFPIDPQFGVPPVINMLYNSHKSGKIKRGELLNIQVSILGVEDNTRIQRIWRINGTKIDQNMVNRMRTTLSDSNAIILDTQFLEEGTSYILTLRVDNELNWLSSTISYQFMILKFPKPCTCLVSPSFGYALITEFTFRCPNCETDLFDFEYGFLDSEYQLSIPIANSPFSSLNKSVVQYLPSSRSTQLQVYVKIVDSETGADMKFISDVTVLLPNVTEIEDLKSLISKWTKKAADEKYYQTLGMNVFNSASISLLVTNIKNQLMSSRRSYLSAIDELVKEVRENLIAEFANDEITRQRKLNPLTSDSLSTTLYTGFSLLNGFNMVSKSSLSLLMRATDKCLKEACTNQHVILIDGVEKLLSGLLSLLFDRLNVHGSASYYDNQFLRLSLCHADLQKRSMLLGGNPASIDSTYSSIITNRQFGDEFSDLSIVSSHGKVVLPKLHLTSLKPWSYSFLVINNQALFDSDSTLNVEKHKITKTFSKVKSRPAYLSVLNEKDQTVNLQNLTNPIMFTIPLSDPSGTNSTTVNYLYECKVLNDRKITSAPSCSFSLLNNLTGICACYDNNIIGVVETKVEYTFLDEETPTPFQVSLAEGDVIWIPLVVMAGLISIMVCICIVYVIIGCCKQEKQIIEPKPEMKYKNFALNPKFVKKLVKTGDSTDLEENAMDGEWEMQ